MEGNTTEDVRRLEREFKACRRMLMVLGDETRQHLLCVMLQGDCGGSRIIDLATQTNLSRPAVSHHMRILKEAGIVKSRKESTRAYYYLDPAAEEIEGFITLFCHIREFMKKVPDRSGCDD